MTLTRIAQVLAGFGLLLGLIHLGMLAAIQGGAPAQRLWFAGTGLAIIFAAIINLIALAVHGRMVAWIAVGASLSIVALFLAALPVLDGP